MKEEVVFESPRTDMRRTEIARKCCANLELTIPCVVDTTENHVDEMYAAWPERIFVVGSDGRIAYAGRPGPWGFKPDELERWLKTHAR